MLDDEDDEKPVSAIKDGDDMYCEALHHIALPYNDAVLDALKEVLNYSQDLFKEGQDE